MRPGKCGTSEFTSAESSRVSRTIPKHLWCFPVWLGHGPICSKRTQCQGSGGRNSPVHINFKTLQAFKPCRITLRHTLHSTLIHTCSCLARSLSGLTPSPRQSKVQLSHPELLYTCFKACFSVWFYCKSGSSQRTQWTNIMNSSDLISLSEILIFSTCLIFWLD